MDGDALATLLTISPGPDSLKELIKKVGVRLKVYQLIKSLYSDETVSNSHACMHFKECMTIKDEIFLILYRLIQLMTQPYLLR